MTEEVLPESSDSTTVEAQSRPEGRAPDGGDPTETFETLVGPGQAPPPDDEQAVEGEAEPLVESVVAAGGGDQGANGQSAPAPSPLAEPAVPAAAPPPEEALIQEPPVAVVEPEPTEPAEPEPEPNVPEPVSATPLVDDGMWDAVLVALGTEPPIPAAMAPETPPPPPAGHDEGADAPAAAADEFAPSPEGPGHDAVATISGDMADEDTSDGEMSEEDEVAAFWNPPEPESEPNPEPIPEPEPDPVSAAVEAPLPRDPAPMPARSVPTAHQPGEPTVAPEPWLAGDDEEFIGLQSLAAEWAVNGGGADTARSSHQWETDGTRSRPWRRAVAPLAGRWATMKRGERVNVVLYALTGVSIVAMALELLAGPDALPTDVSTAPAPVVSPTTTRPQSTTITFTIPPPAEEPAPAAPPVTGGDGNAVPVRPTPTVAAADPQPEPEPEPEPTDVPPITTTPTTASPPTTRRTPPTSSSFPEPTPPVLPTFPGQIREPAVTSPSP